jgi:hypothetical protein
MLAKGKNYHANIFYEFPIRKKYGVPSHNFVKKNVLCEKGDEITRFDGTTYTLQSMEAKPTGTVTE